MSPKRIFDHAFIQLILDGNKHSFSQILEEYYDDILYHISKIVYNKEDARDLTNDTFNKAYLNLNLFKPSYKFSSWLYKIATNTAIDFLRKKKVRYDISGIAEEHTQIVGEDSADTNINERENYATLKDAINKLKPEYRAIIRLRYYDELSYEEIANKLHIPIGTVKANLHRAKAILSKIIINQKP